MKTGTWLVIQSIPYASNSTVSCTIQLETLLCGNGTSNALPCPTMNKTTKALNLQINSMAYENGISSNILFFFVYLEGDTFYFPVHGRKWGRGSTTSSYKYVHVTSQTYIVVVFYN